MGLEVEQSRRSLHLTVPKRAHTKTLAVLVAGVASRGSKTQGYITGVWDRPRAGLVRLLQCILLIEYFLTWVLLLRPSNIPAMEKVKEIDHGFPIL